MWVSRLQESGLSEGHRVEDIAQRKLWACRVATGRDGAPERKESWRKYPQGHSMPQKPDKHTDHWNVKQAEGSTSEKGGLYNLESDLLTNK